MGGRNGPRPEKPTPDFPLFPHACGLWAKKIGGKLRYFGPWSDSDAALSRYHAERPSWDAGAAPVRQNDVSLLDACNAFLIAKEALIGSGGISERTYHEYKRIATSLCDELGDNAAVAKLRAAQFDALRERLSARLGPATITKTVQVIRSIFKYAFEADLIDNPVKFGPNFRGATKRQKRSIRNQRGERLFSADEIRKLIAEAFPTLKAAILLGINCGFGQTDVSRLPVSGVDLDSGWIDFPRPKTQVHRRCKLWPETIEALRACGKNRPSSASKENAGLFFLTRNGIPLVEFHAKSNSVKDAITLAMRRLLRKLSTDRPGIGKLLTIRSGVGFYALRHTFQTIADRGKDFPAVRSVMGHADSDSDMSAVYRERIEDDRLIAAAEVVRQWLFCANP